MIKIKICFHHQSFDSELGVIEDYEQDYGQGGVSSSWEDNAASEEIWNSEDTFRDIRQAERERRIAEHKRIRMEKEMKKSKVQRGLVATKIS